MKSINLRFVFVLFLVILEQVVGQGSSAPRAHAYRVKSLCYDYPHSDGSDAEFKDKANQLEIDAAVWTVNRDGREEVYIFYHNVVMKFRFESAGNTPILDTTREDQNITKLFAGLSKVTAAFSAGRLFYLIDQKSKQIQIFDGNLVVQTLPGDEVKKRNPWLQDNPGNVMFAPIRIAGKGSNGSLLVHWRTASGKSKRQAGNGTKPKGGGGGGPGPNKAAPYKFELYDIETLAKPNRGDVEGYLVSGFGRGLEPITLNSRGMYFTSDGRACHFNKDNYANDFRLEPKTEMNDINHQPPCWLASVFLGCPQSFCYQSDLDDIYYYKRHTNAPVYMLFREAYFYQVAVDTGKPLPMKAPRVADVKFQKSVTDIEQLMENIDAAFNFQENNTWITVMIKNDIVKYYENDKLVNTDTDKPAGVFEGFGQSVRIDTAVFDQSKKFLYVFFGNHYSTYARDMPRGLNRWKPVKANQTFDDFKGLPPYLDASLDHFNGKLLYFLRGSYYYQMNVGDNPSANVFDVKPSIVDTSGEEGLFHIEGCPEQNKKLNLKSRYRDFKPARYVPVVGSTGDNKTTWNPIWITLIATIAFVVLSLLIGAFFLLDKKRRRKIKKKKGKKGKKAKKGKSDRKSQSSSIGSAIN
ncbi:hypothetical protein B4U80_13616 [Leptotrombidium deliense]|uniref:Uncharacterized protein n=1 Tax=Leptotrombidium deliense TaxID=299467 RepID=A0A443SSZ2_9ACAR|nr:hypothetical protein B4U80_13616 [Leptotrombidium deliense]